MLRATMARQPSHFGPAILLQFAAIIAIMFACWQLCVYPFKSFFARTSLLASNLSFVDVARFLQLENYLSHTHIDTLTPICCNICVCAYVYTC